MEIKKLIGKEGLLFLIGFSVVVFFSQKINLATLVGAQNQFFTLFQMVGPLAAMFLGPVVGVVSVLIAEIAEFLVSGKAWTLVNLLRLLPMLFAAYYLGVSKEKFQFRNLWISLIVPLLAIGAFVLHPVGRTVWYFALFWTIPIIVKILPAKIGHNLYLRGLGTTFTAHAIGGAIWIYTIPMSATQWQALVPIVIVERCIFAAGIAVSYVLVNTAFAAIKSKMPNTIVHVDKNYVLGNLLKAKV